jgi:dihydroorotate dehydrogenase (NAD+) catalytic subunit
VEAVGHVPIKGEGGIAIAQDMIDQFEAGARYISIGSAHAGMYTTKNMGQYHDALVYDMENGTNNAESLLKDVNTRYVKVRIKKIIDCGCDFKLYITDTSIDAGAGQYVFAWLPGIGEKPFSVMDNDPFTLGVQTRGYLTRAFNTLKVGDTFYYRGEYGEPINVPDGSDVVAYGGGCGIAGIFLPVKDLSTRGNNVTVFLAAKDADNLAYLNEFKKYGNVYVATEDGSAGVKGLITDLFGIARIPKDSYHFGCGPDAMTNALLHYQMMFSSPDKIFASKDHITRCGIGLCNSCADKYGNPTCGRPFTNTF